MDATVEAPQKGIQFCIVCYLATHNYYTHVIIAAIERLVHYIRAFL